MLPLSGGLGGFGLELAEWLVSRGARKLVLTSRNGIKTGYQSLRVRIWRSCGVTVVISLADITTKSGVTALLSNANLLGQVDAIFNLAVVSVEVVQLEKVHSPCSKAPNELLTMLMHLAICLIGNKWQYCYLLSLCEFLCSGINLTVNQGIGEEGRE